MLSACLVNKEPIFDIWQTIEETETDTENRERRHLIGNVVKASDGSFQLFSDLKSHIGTNRIGCCGRSFVTDKKIRKNKVSDTKRQKICSLKWKSAVQKVAQSEEKTRKTIYDKTYSTYALDHKFRQTYASLRIGTKNLEKPKKKITIELQPEKIMGKKNRLRRPSVVEKCQLRVADDIELDDFEESEEEEEEAVFDPKETKKKKKKSVQKAANKWYAEFVNFHSKKRVIEGLLKDKSRRGSVLESEIDKTDSIWISENERAMASAVVSTLLEAQNAEKESHRRRMSEGNALKINGDKGSLQLPNEDRKAVSAPVTPAAERKKKSILKKQKSNKNLNENTPKLRRKSEASPQTPRKSESSKVQIQENEEKSEKKKRTGFRRRKKKLSSSDVKESDPILSTADLFPELGKENVERVVMEICNSNPKWAPVIANHHRILSRGIRLEFDTYLKGAFINQVVNAGVKKVAET